MAEQVIGQRNQEFRAQAANWLQTEISSKQQQYFAAVDKKCNSAHKNFRAITATKSATQKSLLRRLYIRKFG